MPGLFRVVVLRAGTVVFELGLESKAMAKEVAKGLTLREGEHYELWFPLFDDFEDAA